MSTELETIKKKFDKPGLRSQTYEFHTRGAYSDMPSDESGIKNHIRIAEEDGIQHYVHLFRQRYNSYREFAFKIDRLYYLEIANGTISDHERLLFVCSVIGKRQFGKTKRRLNLYIKDTDIDTQPLIGVVRKMIKQPPDLSKRIIYERKDRNLNIYEALLFKWQGRFFALLEQRNISKTATIVRSFVIQLDSDLMESIKKTRLAARKIDIIFSRMGRIHMQSLPASVTEESKSVSEENVQETELPEPSNEANLQMTSQSEAAHLYTQMYMGMITYLSNPDDTEAKKQFLSQIKAYEDNAMCPDHCGGITAQLKNLEEMIKSDRLANNLTNDPGLKEIFISCMDDIEFWQNDIYAHEQMEHEDLLAAIIDLEENLKYKFNLLMKMQEEDTPPCDEKYIEELEQALHHEESKQVISSKDLLDEEMIDFELVEELIELEADLNNALYMNEMLNADTFKYFDHFFHRYARMLNSIYEFKDLGYSLTTLTDVMENTSISELECEKDGCKHVLMLLKSVANDLQSWREHVITNADAADVHYMDASLFSNIQQIEILLKADDSAAHENELEFF